MAQAKQNPVELESTTTMANIIDDGDFIDDDTAAAFSKPEPAPLTSKIDISKVKVSVEPSPAPSLMKNAEGYYDPTAGAAINNTDKPSPKKGNKYPMPGEVWDIDNEKDGRSSKYFVVHVSDEFVHCLSLMIANKSNTYSCKYKFTISVDYPTNTQDYYADASRVWTKPKRYCKKCMRDADISKLEEAKSLIVHGLNLQNFVITKEVEKVVEKVVEKPVEKIVEKIVEVAKPVDQAVPKKPAILKLENPVVPVSYVAHEAPEGCVLAKDAEIAMLKKELDIWKMLAQRYLPVGPGGVEATPQAKPVSQVINTTYA